MRILHVHSGNIFGGVERILITLAGHKNYSPNFQHEFALCCKDRLETELKNSGAEIHPLPEVHLSRPWELRRARAILWGLLEKIKFDLAVVHSSWAHCVFGKTLKSAGLPFLFWLHSAAAGPRLLEHWSRRNPPRCVISVSQFVNETAAKRLFPKTPSHVVYSPLPVDLSVFAAENRHALRLQLGANRDTVVIIQASRMEPWKGHRQLIEALALIKNEPRWTCWIAGQSKELQNFAAEKGLAARVKFLGPGADIPALLNAADIYCQPNLEPEGFSIAFLEAACAELPIVTSNFPSASEILGDPCESLAPPGDIGAVAKTLANLVNDADARQRLGARARERALQLCDRPTQFRQLEEILAQTVNNG